MMSIISFGMFAQGTLDGYLKNEDDKPLEFANVVLKQNNEIVIVVSSDIDGYYIVENLKEGKYEVTIEIQGKTSDSKIITISNKDVYSFNLAMNTTNEIKPIIIKAYPSLFRKDKPTIIEYKSATIDQSGKKDLAKVLESGSSITKDKDGNMSFRGSRPGSASYVVDGIPVNGVLNIPTSAIYSMRVYTSGIPAKFGNATGAIIEVRTKSYFDFFN